MRTISTRYVLGIDIGTTSVKVVLASSEGKLVAESNKAHDLLSLHPNWAEEDAAIWWQNVIAAVKELSEKEPEAIKKVECIGCSGMVPAIVMLDADGNPVRNTIQQNDARSTEQIDRLLGQIDQEMLFSRTGGYTNQQHILPRILWVKENEPDVFAHVRWIMGSYDYVLYKLSGEMSIEMNWAVESGAFDIRTQEWIPEVLDDYGVSSSLLPPVNESMKVVAKTLPEMEELMGLPGGIPIIAGGADHVSSTLAAGIVTEGDLLIKFGGAGDILYCTESIKTSPKLFFDYHDVPGKYLINGCMAASGSLVKWFTKDIMGADDPDILKKLDNEASALPPSADGLVILPYFIGEKTPLFDPYARGVIYGLTLAHTQAHIFRAVLEAVIYGFRHHIDVIEEMGYHPKRIMATNGGSKSKFWCQIAADVLNSEICAFPHHPGSALGVAFMAGMSVGVFDDWEQIRTFLTEYAIYKPQPDAVKIYNKAYRIYRNLYEQLKPAYEATKTLYED